MSDDPVDPRPEIEEACKPGCQKYWKEYEACAERVQAKGEGHCSGQYFDFYHCIDACAAPKVFKTVK
ncbi:Cytochrome b-c1 complex subunit 6 [Hondaea fermentalgiana]|uniref:Cytochrome b-c1 complex subunit 6 n=1 Tax=Hondaea fermentalgiana TaxID=2315210 RepID=A0A2R5GQT1_9STRA|nr:Cytochrome b-c1 complex subunit 6 [Hondaea fermentalgiana]|eukprot:GBG32669.1 Cytochrome b-c1 complex subunit 6 [Hondaea fermentalgiana]